MIRKLVALLTALLLLAAACGSDDADVAADDAAGSGGTDQAATGEAADGDASGSEDADGGDADDDDGEPASSGDDAGGDSGEDAAPDDGAGSDDGETTGMSSIDGEPLGALLFADESAGEGPATARFEGRFTVRSGPGGDAPDTYDLVIAGAYDLDADASELTMDMSELLEAAAAAESDQIPAGFDAFLSEPIQIITIGDDGWIKWGLLGMFTGEADAWLALGPDDIDTTTEGFGFSSSSGDPTALLESLEAAEAELTEVGTETVRGVETTHWRALVDLETLAEDASTEERAELEAQFGDLSQSAFPVDLWLGVDDGYLYRYRLDLASEAFFDGGEEIEAATMTFEFYDYGADVGIAPPPASEIIDGDSLGF